MEYAIDYPTPLPLRIFQWSTWVLLFLLIPIGVLGFFAENSNPGDGLYPVKRDIEGIVLRMESLNTVARAFYQIDLASTRLKEASKVTLADNNTQALNDFSAQVTIAAEEINALPDGPEKVKAKQQLLASISDYQQTLLQLHQDVTINVGSLTPTTSEIHAQSIPQDTASSVNTSTTTTSTTHSTSESTPTPTPVFNSHTEETIVSPTPTAIPQTPATPTPTPTPQDTLQAVQDAQTALEIARLELLPTYTLGSNNPPQADWQQNGGVVVYGTDGSWCYDNVGYNGSITTQGTCEDGHTDTTNAMQLDHTIQTICLPQFSQDAIGIVSCHVQSSGGERNVQKVACTSPIPAYCSHLVGHGSVCSSDVCTAATSGQGQNNFNSNN